MKSLFDFLNHQIKEGFINEDSITKVESLKVIYNTGKKITVKVPNIFSESDMQIYIDDKLLNDMPGSDENSKKVLGENIKNINDAYFTYNHFSASSSTSNGVDLDWDENYGADGNFDGFVYYTLDDLTYHIDFSSFNLSNVEDNVQEYLEKIFKSLESNNTNKYPIKIFFDSVEYEK